MIIDSQTGAPAPFTVLGIVAGFTAGTGNVGDISAVTLSEVNAVSSTPGVVEFDRGAGGELRMHAVAGSGVLQLGLINVSAFTPQAEGLGFDSGPNPTTLVFGVGPQSSQPDGFAVVSLVAGTYPTLFVGGEQVVIGVDNEVDVTVTFTALDQTRAQVAARINAAMGFTCMTTPGGVSETFTGRANGGQFRVTAGPLRGSRPSSHSRRRTCRSRLPRSRTWR